MTTSPLLQALAARLEGLPQDELETLHRAAALMEEAAR